MSLEQAILDRLEKRNAQIEMLQQTIQAMSHAADAEREHTRQQLGPLIEENKKLAAQIESDENVSQSNREHAQYQIASLTAEVARLRAEVPLESTREGLKNATAKIAELKNDVRRCYELADEIGRGDGESIVDLITRQAGRITGLIAKLQEVTTDRDRVLNELAAIVAEANKSGRCGGDPVALLKQGQVDRDTAESLDRQLGAALALSNERAQEIRKLMDGHAEDVKAQAELLSKYESLLTKITDLGSYAMTLGRKEGEPLEMFMERQALRLAALESKAGPSIDVQVMAHDLGDELEKAKGEEARLRALLDESCRTRIGLEFERDKMKAKLRPLEEFYAILKQYRDQRAIGLNAFLIYDHVITVELALSQLTA